MPAQNLLAEFANKLRTKEPVFGTFVKSPSYHATEILGGIGFDFIVIDEEHAPINRETIDSIILAAASRGMAPVVRVGEPTDFNIMAQLDAGAAGVMIPHVNSPEKAAAVAGACRYRNGRRGFSKTGRAGNYGAAGLDAHLENQDANALCIAMIEDPEAIGVIDQIVAEDISAVFIGRGDLSVAMGEKSQTAAPVMDATSKVVEAALRADKPVLALAVNDDDQANLMAAGVRAFLRGSDQGFLRSAATAALSACRTTASRAAAS